MKSLLPVALLALLGACGGTSYPVEVSSGGSLLSDSPLLPPDPVEELPSDNTLTGDVSFAGLLNDVRADNGAAAVSYNAQLDAAAQAHADDMLRNGYFSHTGLDGSSPGDRARRAGYDWRTYGENIASGYRSEEGVMAGWTGSPGHHANNINPAFEEFGLGLAMDGRGSRWVLLLGAQ